MKIGLTSDLHIFLTKEKNIRKMFKELVTENCDVWVIAGDHSGTVNGLKGSRAIFRIAREYYDGPILACLGNHDYWVRGTKKKKTGLYGGDNLYTNTYNHPDLARWNENYDGIVAAAKEHKIHLFEEDGVYRYPDMWGFTFAGHGLWYKYPPNSNDHLYMPTGVEGDTHRHLYKKTTDAMLNQLNQLNDQEDGIRIFVSHFPVIEIDDQSAPWCGDPFLGAMLRDEYQFTTFLNGHSHGNKNGPMRWECGSDYHNPKYKIVGV